MLEFINSPADIKALSNDDLLLLCDEIRKVILDTVSKNGGHLASNLGIVEATIALHRVFNSPSDKFVFDVGHQCYTHKLLTGRYRQFTKLRRAGGLSGFTNKNESIYDVFNEGHCGTSISTALGLASADCINGNDSYSIAIVGDGAFTNGMIYEALNNCSNKKMHLIILLNDNEMSISKNIGGVHNYLSQIRTSEQYFSFKHRFQHALSHVPIIGKGMISASKKLKDFMKRFVVKETIFEKLGIDYIGPVDGNNIEKLSVVFEEAKSRGTCCLIHMVTKKGKGYSYAEREPDKYHSVGAFDIDQGILKSESMSFSNFFGSLLCDYAEKDKSICAITAAMCDGTGLTEFSQKYPQRFFDVGIAEEHAITFSAGLSASGMKPVCILYSTFAQRVFDQAFHDIAIQNLPMILALDRCGLVPGDGITHQGIFDYALFSSIPNIQIYSPETYSELAEVFTEALNNKQFNIIRYPKGGNLIYDSAFKRTKQKYLSYTNNTISADVVIISYGRISSIAYSATSILLNKYNVGLIKLVRIEPIDYGELQRLTASAKLIYIVEEGIISGGVGEKISAYLHTNATVLIHAINGFIEHGDLDELYRSAGFDANTIADKIVTAMKGFSYER